MHQFPRLPRIDRIHAELVRTRVDAKLVRSHHPRDGRVLGQIGIEGIQVPDIVYALLKAADVAWRQAYPLHPKPPQLTGHKIVLHWRGGRFRLVNRDLQFEGSAAHGRSQVPEHRGRVGNGPPVLGRGPCQGHFVKNQPQVLHLERSAKIAPVQFLRRTAQFGPGQRVYLVL